MNPTYQMFKIFLSTFAGLTLVGISNSKTLLLLNPSITPGQLTVLSVIFIFIGISLVSVAFGDFLYSLIIIAKQYKKDKSKQELI